MQKIIIIFIFLLSTSLATSESVSSTDYKDSCYVVKDPFEKFNRSMFTFNTTLDGMIVRPVVGLYIGIVPKWPRDRIHNFFDHLRLPLTLVNNALQRDSKGFSNTFGRFLVNTLFGLGGFIDYASLFDDMDKDNQKFDDTLSRYKVPYGSYLVLPLIGNTTTRGAIGKIGDYFLNPINYKLTTKEGFYYAVSDNLDQRIQYNDLINATRRSSVDYYGKVRSMYIQYISRRSLHCPTNQPIDYSMYEDKEGDGEDNMYSEVSESEKDGEKNDNKED